jgi:hypothetical protein
MVLCPHKEEGNTAYDKVRVEQQLIPVVGVRVAPHGEVDAESEEDLSSDDQGRSLPILLLAC